MRILLLLSFCLAALRGPLHAQPAVLFRTGAEVLPENVKAFAERGTIAAEEMVGDYYYRLIQFHALPDKAAHRAIDEAGIVLLDYLPHHAYVAALPVGLDPAVLAGLGVRSIVPLHPWRKIAPPLLAGDFGEWAVERGYASVIVKFYKNIDHQSVRRFCESKGWTIEKDNGYNNYLQLRLRTDELMALAREPWVAWIDRMPEPGEPEDVLGRALHRANVLDSPLPSGRHYDGSGLSVLVRDDGAIGPHIDFEGRLNQDFVGPSRGSHGDMVAGIFAGAGNIDPYVRGMAAGAYLYVVDYEASFLDETMYLHYNHGVLVTNSSYSNGCNAGYTATTETVDQQVYENPTLIHVFSAGNNNGSECGYGAGNQWGNITGGHKQGKNVIATANLTANATLVSSSSRGPAYDGRIKPDIAANGSNQMSTDPDNGYSPGGGTSAAAPSIAGVTTQLIHAYQSIYGQLPQTGLIKAVMLNTANDLGEPGPDFQFGWGLVNAWRAVLTLEEGRFLEGEVAQNATATHTIVVPEGVRELRVMTYWMDPPATAMAARALVNDLDTRLLGPDSSSHLPLVLDHRPDPDLLSQPAVPGIDTLNNMEQVRISDPPAGTWTLEVTGKEVPFGTRPYFVVWEFRTDEITFTRPAGGEQFVPGETERIHWDAHGTDGTWSLSYSPNGGQTWLPIATFDGAYRMFDWQVPAVLGGDIRLRLERDSLTAVSEPFTIMHQPQNVQVTQACPEFIRVEWDAPAGADSFVVYRLGSKYMDSVDVTTDTWYEFPTQDGNPTLDYWFAVAAYGPQGQLSRRTVAIGYHDGLLNCPLMHDAELVEILQPSISKLVTCNEYVTDLTVRIRNGGQSDESELTLYYQINDQPPVSAQLTDLEAGSEYIYTFAEPLVFDEANHYTLKVWTDLAGDEAYFNDMRETDFYLWFLIGNGAPVPLAEDFEGITWPPINWLVDNPDDFITWRPHEVIGPDGQTTTAAHINNFQYSAQGERDQLVSTPVDLTQSSRAVLEFDYAYAQYSSQYADTLLIEVLTDCGTTLADTIYHQWGSGLATVPDYDDIYTPEAAEDWKHLTLDISAFAGQSITVRFTNITGYGNSLYLDNINIREMKPPANAQILTDGPALPCEGDFIVFEAQAEGDFLQYEWDFGPDAWPQTKTGPGPHSILFALAGTYEVTLTVYNELDTLLVTHTIDIAPYPVASFEAEVTGQAVTFQNTSQYADEVFWDFGDGETTTIENPAHVYLEAGVYVVKLTATNDCGSKTVTDTLYVGTTAITELDLKYRLELAPNPTSSEVNVSLVGPPGSKVSLALIDLHGRVWRKTQVRLQSDEVQLLWPLDLPKGIYLVRLQDDKDVLVRKLVVQ